MVLHAWIKHCSLKIASLDVLGTQISCASQHHATSVDNPQAFKCGPRICFRRASEILLQILHNQTAQPAQAPITVLAALSTCMYTEPPWRWLRLLEPLGPMHYVGQTRFACESMHKLHLTTKLVSACSAKIRAKLRAWCPKQNSNAESTRTLLYACCKKSCESRTMLHKEMKPSLGLFPHFHILTPKKTASVTLCAHVRY